MSMLDRTGKKPLVNVPDASNFSNWEEFAKELFAKCLEWPDGPIHSDQSIRTIATNLVELIDSISFIELTSYETRDLKEFFGSYKLLLGALEVGPGKQNGFHLSLFKPKEKLFAIFAKQAGEVIEVIQTDLSEIGAQSHQAQIIHTNGLDSEMNPADPQVKSRIKMTDELVQGLENLRLISQGKPLNPIISDNPGSSISPMSSERGSIVVVGKGPGPMDLAS